MSPARILHVYKYFRPSFTGEGIFLERLAPVFARLRPDVTHEVLVSATRNPGNASPPAYLAAVHYLARSESGASQRDIVAWLARNGRRYAVVHHHTHVDRSFLGNVGLKLMGCRIALSATLDDSVEGLLRSYRPAFRPLVRILFGVIDKFIAISPKLFDENNRFVSREKSALVPVGVPLPDPDPHRQLRCRKKLAIAPDATLLVSVGGICERKDQLFIVEQLPALLEQAPNLLLMLVGPVLDTNYQTRIERFVADHNLGAHVRYAGFSETPQDYYQAADIMVFSSRDEGFGAVMIEAMANSLPVVARRLPGVNDTFIRDGRTGFLFTRGDEFLTQVTQLLHDTDLRQKIGACGRAFVAAHFDIEEVAARYLELYNFPAGGVPGNRNSINTSQSVSNRARDDHAPW